MRSIRLLHRVCTRRLQVKKCGAGQDEAPELESMILWLPGASDDIEEVFGEDPWPYGVEVNRKTLELV
jgi:hypothetical protein